ncbi:sterol desaturase family protein [Flammeovirgaceae bacterium SG7u.111]|nr:sterol desaturase family protein [Flammeovirgaceae bacterium SG7u.132]WPO34844.1 sterol desaturase family protein [Flammeovirgaceae bacterium SG7u.111]
MEKYIELFKNGYVNYANWVWNQITFNYSEPWWKNYFYYLIAISAFFFLLELVKPWRKEQPKFRKDFWLDFFYMFFNFFLFSLIIFNAASDVFVNLFNDFLDIFGINNLVAINVGQWPVWAQLALLFVVKDFAEWWVHRLLHTVPALWEFHKVHHSVEQMGFAAHLRYHWMENVVYKSIVYLPLAMIGFGIDDFFVVHIFAIAIGHWNHANFRVKIGPLKYILNNPNMHMWHHAYHMPESHPRGINFGLTLSIWDYIFRTAYIPHSGKDIKLGFPGLEKFPKSFVGQSLHGLGLKKGKKEESSKVI